MPCADGHTRDTGGRLLLMLGLLALCAIVTFNTIAENRTLLFGASRSMQRSGTLVPFQVTHNAAVPMATVLPTRSARSALAALTALTR